MFRIRRIFDDVIPFDRRVIAQVQEIWRSQFPAARASEVAELPDRLRDSAKYHFRTLLFVADDAGGNIRGYAIVLHVPDLHFCFLDYIASNRQLTGSGVGGALYERVRHEARMLHCRVLLLECPPDDPAAYDSPDVLKSAVARLRFYERYGVRPITNTAYETPVKPEDRAAPFLMVDDLDRVTPLRRDPARRMVRYVLENKYGYLCPAEYVQKVVDSFRDDPVQLRPFKYVKPDAGATRTPPESTREKIILVINDKHDIHHVRDRGYVEAPVRIAVIKRELDRTGAFREIQPKEFSESQIRAVHNDQFVDYLKRVCREVPPGKSVYPYVFPIRNATRPPKELAIRAGYYCIDTFTPLNQNAYLAAKRAVDCTLTAADSILRGDRVAYALIRPPGHHAEHRAFGGFCYFNNCAIAAQYLCAHGKAAILDVDYHHGNGQEVIFYERSDVLTVSIHGHPRFAYPYFSGFEDEKGAGPGEGFNLNIPLPEKVDGPRYRMALERALSRIRRFAPSFLIVALGLDTAKGDPTGTWSLTPKDLMENGRMIGRLRLPTLVVQEGGYRTRTLGVNARHFLLGLAESAFGWPAANEKRESRTPPATASALKSTETNDNDASTGEGRTANERPG
jgi:acetoin utilization deacetylase AcuC-like enzyme/GNAT superfamily N-acetyltransferase